MARARVEVEVRRGGRETSVPAEDVVVDDVLVLSAGDVAPADCRVIESHDLLVDEAAPTCEYPAEKRPGMLDPGTPLSGRSNSLFMGTHVVSGAGQAIVTTTGRATQFGAVSAQLGGRRPRTGFERGITAFGMLLVRAMVVLVTTILVINLLLRRLLIDSVLFSLALALGLTPQLLPAIVSVSLATGARRMAAEQVVVKRLAEALLLSSIAIAAGTIALPYSPLAQPLGLTGIPARILAALAGLTASYVIANEWAKRRFPAADPAATQNTT